MMMVFTTFTRAWDWLVNTNDGVNVYEGNITQSHNHVNSLRSEHPGLRELTAVEHENNALAIYRNAGYYYRWDGGEENPDWEINTPANQEGVDYADDVRDLAGGF